MHYNCLIVDDEVDLAKMTCEYFEMFDVSSAYVTGAQAYYDFQKENSWDLLLLDINLQQESGFALCKKIREESTLPILFISARQSDDDALMALNIGGDDYIKKPYAMSVLLAKVKNILKRMGGLYAAESKADTLLECGPVKVDKALMRVTVGDRQEQLKAREFKLFLYLFEHRNTIVTKEELFSQVWRDAFFSDGTLNVHIHKLRDKLEQNPNEPEMIKTIWGTGYLLELHE